MSLEPGTSSGIRRRNSSLCGLEMMATRSMRSGVPPQAIEPVRATIAHKQNGRQDAGRSLLMVASRWWATLHCKEDWRHRAPRSVYQLWINGAGICEPRISTMGRNCLRWC